jgi:hypothetical protein
MQPWKVMFFALFLTSNIITMLVRNLVHGYKHDSATGFVCFAYFPLSFDCPRIFFFFFFFFFFGILELVCFFTLFCFCYIEASLGSRGRGSIESVFQGPVPILFSCSMGRMGILKTWVLSLIPTWIISIFSSEYWGYLAWISPVRQGGNRCFTWLSPSEAEGGGGGEYWRQLLPILQGWGTLSLPTSKSE